MLTTEPTTTIVENALSGVIDPELGINVLDLGLIYGIAVTEAGVRVAMTLTTPGCPLHESLTMAVAEAIRTAVPDVERVTVDLVWEPEWTPERLSERGRRALGWD